tara:strand:+ start:88 stop:504 length:417 start_codon:yes stop_codon:yes gene_type:complete
MHISPCGWFAIEEPKLWLAEESPNSTRFIHSHGHGSIEVTSARKSVEINEDKIIEVHEKMSQYEVLSHKETSMVNLDSGPNCLRSAFANENYIRLFAHVYWSHYCAFIDMTSPIDEHLNHKLNAFHELLDSFQPLTQD